MVKTALLHYKQLEAESKNPGQATTCSRLVCILPLGLLFPCRFLGAMELCDPCLRGCRCDVLWVYESTFTFTSSFQLPLYWGWSPFLQYYGLKRSAVAGLQPP